MSLGMQRGSGEPETRCLRPCWYDDCYFLPNMLATSEADSRQPSASEEGESDLFFKCEHCGIPLVVDRAAAGMTLTCQRCGNPTAVPSGDSAVAPMSNIGGNDWRKTRRI